MGRKADLDVLVVNHGSVVMVHLHTETAKNWVKEHVHSPNYFGENLVVEPRYLGDLMDGMALGELKIG